MKSETAQNSPTSLTDAFVSLKKTAEWFMEWTICNTSFNFSEKKKSKSRERMVGALNWTELAGPWEIARARESSRLQVQSNEDTFIIFTTNDSSRGGLEVDWGVVAVVGGDRSQLNRIFCIQLNFSWRGTFFPSRTELDLFSQFVTFPFR